jgi:hypothetical protein
MTGGQRTTMSTPVPEHLPTVVSRSSKDSELALLELQLNATQSTHQYLGAGRFGLSKSQDGKQGNLKLCILNFESDCLFLTKCQHEMTGDILVLVQNL